MSLINLQEVCLSFGGPALLDHVNLQIEPGERLCLIGRNGEGKSTLLKLMAGEIPPDSGRIIRQPGLKSAMLSQEVPRELNGPVFEVVAGGLGALMGLLSRHHALGLRLAAESDQGLLDELASVEHELETAGGWQAQQRITAVLSRLELDPDARFEALSGGLKRRVLLARALVLEPDLLLLDEPTNHLDIEAITWLEQVLLTAGCSQLFVPHDRMRARKLATRVIDLDRGQLTSWAGSYDNFMARKEASLTVEAEHQKKFDKLLSQEEAWIRQGIKARRTRNEGRVRALESLRAEHRARRSKLGTARLQVQEAAASGRLVMEVEGLTYHYGREPVVQDLTTTILRGDKVGIIGANGCGKTTLLKLLLGEMAPQAGRVRLGTNLQIAYFDQLRMQLDEEKTVADNVAEGNDAVLINGRSKHIIGYLKDFLFTPERARSPVRILSGGERNRLLLAKLFSKPANLLVLDEPTNDLDVETLELLEELLLEFAGTVLLVSHDRAFLNNVVTSTLVFEGNGRVVEYAGGYDDWLSQRQPQQASPTKPVKEPAKAREKPRAAGPRKLSFKEKKELEELPGRIEVLEAEQQGLYARLADPAFYQQGAGEAGAAKSRLEELDSLLAAAYARWEELEALPER